MIFGSGEYRYEVVEGWFSPPEGMDFGVIPSVACDSLDRVYVFSRSDNPMAVFDQDGNFLDTWGGELFLQPHAVFVDRQDNLYCVDNLTHCIHIFDSDWEPLRTLGTMKKPGANPGIPFNRPTDVDILSTGELFVSDGYGNRHVHKFSPDGELLKTWGGEGTGPGQFVLPHSVRVDSRNRVWVCDRTNCRIQIFDTDGQFLQELTGFGEPNAVYFDPREEVVYLAERLHQVSILTLDGDVITQWGGGAKSEKPGEFIATPHGIWADSRGDLYVAEAETENRLQKFARIR